MTVFLPSVGLHISFTEQYSTEHRNTDPTMFILYLSSLCGESVYGLTVS